MAPERLRRRMLTDMHAADVVDAMRRPIRSSDDEQEATLGEVLAGVDLDAARLTAEKPHLALLIDAARQGVRGHVLLHWAGVRRVAFEGADGE